MIKEYRDRQLGLNAIDQLNNDIKNNPGIGFEIVGYQNTVIKTYYRAPLKTSQKTYKMR